MTEVSPAEARRIAVRAQLLDGSAKDVLSTVRHLGRLQIDPISTVAPPQYLVLWSRLGPYQRAELDRLLWQRKKLFEWNVPIWEHDLEKGLRMLRLAVETHLVTSHFALPLLTRRPGGLVVEMTDGTRGYNAERYRVSTFSTARLITSVSAKSTTPSRFKSSMRPLPSASMMTSAASPY